MNEKITIKDMPDNGDYWWTYPWAACQDRNGKEYVEISYYAYKHISDDASAAIWKDEQGYHIDIPRDFGDEPPRTIPIVDSRFQPAIIRTP